MDEMVNFGYLPEEYSGLEGADIVVLPVAYDGTSTWVKGADKGPEAILSASANMELYDIETDSEVYRRGIFTEDPIAGDITTKEMIRAVNETVGYFLEEGKFPVVIGGEHSVSIGAIEAQAKRFGDISILQLDAHSDLRQEYEGSKYNHACVMARAKELAPIVQVGIRSMDVGEKDSVDKANVFFAKDIHDGDDGWMKKAISRLGKKVYVTIDLDVFDPSIMPATGTPEPGGLGWYEVLTFLKMVFEQKDVTGFDVVELCPQKDNRSPDFLAAKLIYKLLSYKFKEKK